MALVDSFSCAYIIKSGCCHRLLGAPGELGGPLLFNSSHRLVMVARRDGWRSFGINTPWQAWQTWGRARVEKACMSYVCVDA